LCLVVALGCVSGSISLGAELYLTVAAVVRRLGERLKLHDVVFERDVKITVDGFNPLPCRESKGLRVVVLPPSAD